MECRKCMQVAVNGVLTIPDHMPDIDFILRVTSTPTIDNAIVIDKQISFSGRVLICVETVSSKSDCPQTVDFISFETPFIGLIDHCCARTSMDAQMSASIKHQEFKLLNPKCISKLIIVKISLIRLTKSCTPMNAHCSEAKLTLVCKSALPPICPPPHPPKPCKSEDSKSCKHKNSGTQTPSKRFESHSDFNNFHLPQKLEDSNTGHVANASCSICGCEIDHF